MQYFVNKQICYKTALNTDKSLNKMKVGRKIIACVKRETKEFSEISIA